MSPARFPSSTSARRRPSALSVEALELLGRLVAVQHKLVLPLAAAASALNARSAWFTFGYRAREDFLRERFDRGGRWFRDLVRLQDHIGRLPGLAVALCGADGRAPIGQRAALCIMRVATPENLREWIARARETPLIELQKLVASVYQSSAAGANGGKSEEGEENSDAAQQRCADDPVADTMAPRVNVRLQAPPEVCIAYDAARDLHAAVVGREAGLGAFVEALVGEGSGAGCEMAADLHASFLARWMRESGARQAAHAALPVVCPERRATAGTPAHLRTLHGSTPAARRALQILRDFECLDARLGLLQQRITAREQAAAKLSMSRTYARQLQHLATILARLVDLESCLDIAVADLLVELHERRAWKSLGFAGLEDCAESLGLGASTARRRVAVLRRARRFEPVRRAFESGLLGEENTLWVIRRMERMPARTTSPTPWIEHASRASVKHLRDEEKCWRRETLLRHIAVADSMTPGAARRDDSGRDESTESAAATARRAPVPMPAAEIHAAMRRVPGATRDFVFALAYGLLDRVVHQGPLVPTTWRVELPVHQAADLVACIEGMRRGLASKAAAQVSAAQYGQLRPSERMARFFVERAERLPDWLGLLALLEDCVWVWDEPEGMPRRPHAAIYGRDGYRCQAPGCTARSNLDLHHLKYRSRGGTDAHANLLTICRFHHHQGEHGLLAHCEGRAPLDIVWRLGHEELATWWRNEIRLTPRPPRDRIEAILEQLDRGG